MSHLFTTSGTCSSHAALRVGEGGGDSQMMTLFLVKSTLVSCCVYTHEIVCLISRNTVSRAFFFIQTSVQSLWAHFEWDSPFIFWKNTAVISSCVSTRDLWGIHLGPLGNLVQFFMNFELNSEEMELQMKALDSTSSVSFAYSPLHSCEDWHHYVFSLIAFSGIQLDLDPP